MQEEDGLAALRLAVLADPALANALAQHVAADTFRDAALSAASQLGLALDPDAIGQAFAPDPLGLARFQPPAISGGAWPPPGWLPARVLQGAAGPEFDWAYFGMGGLTRPFFEDSVRQTGALPLNRLMRMRHSLDDLTANSPDDAVAPAGFIFHLSRCGSTLLARLLGDYPGHAKISEPEPLDAVLQWAMAQPLDSDGGFSSATLRAVRAIVRALMHNLPPETRAFFKLDCWHVGAYPLIRTAFPDVPCVFLYRDPLEVAVSQRANAGVHVVPGMPGAAMLGIQGGEDVPAEQYIAMVLGRICDLAVHHFGGGKANDLLLHYDDIFAAMQRLLPTHFGFVPDSNAADRIAVMRGDDAKFPGQPFQSDSQAKRAEAGPALVLQIDRYARTGYAQLEAMRRRQDATEVGAFTS
jgi:Sulfotransferase family